MKQKMTIPVLAVVLCAGTVQADGNFLSLPKVNDSAFGYGKSVDGAVSDKLFYTLEGLGDIAAGNAQQYAETWGGSRVEQ